jgi:hypothetical protein
MTSLRRRDDQGSALTLWKEFSPLRALQESAPVLEEELQRTLLTVFHETNPYKRDELLEERRHIREKQEFVRQALPKVELLARQIQEHFDLFCTGKHPRERAILAVGRQHSLSREALKSDLQKFGEILLSREKLERAERRLEELDRLFLRSYLEFQRRAHRQQEVIEELASLERVRLDRLEADEALEVFARLAEDRRLPIIARAIRAQSAEARFSRERAALQKELAEARAFKQWQCSTIDDLRAEKAAREAKIKKLEERLAELESSEREWRRKREERREEILRTVRHIRERESARARRDESFEYDPVHGYLMAEGWRLLRRDLGEGIWHQGKETDHYFFLTLEELLKREDFEMLYFHEEGRRAITAVNAFCRATISQDELLRETAACGFSAAVVEEWLVPLRRKEGLPLAGWLR